MFCRWGKKGSQPWPLACRPQNFLLGTSSKIHNIWNGCLTEWVVSKEIKGLPNYTQFRWSNLNGFLTFDNPLHLKLRLKVVDHLSGIGFPSTILGETLLGQDTVRFSASTTAASDGGARTTAATAFASWDRCNARSPELAKCSGTGKVWRARGEISFQAKEKTLVGSTVVQRS